MKRQTIIFLILLMALNVLGQTKDEISIFTENYDIESISNLKEHLNQYYTSRKKIALTKAYENGWFIKKITDSSFIELVDIYNNIPIYRTIYNADAAISTRTNTLHNNGSLGLNIEGQNMTAYVWDGGIARGTHQEYDGIGGNDRYSIIDGSSELHFHAAHVTGTIMASGVLANAKGMAPQCYVRGFDWTNDLSEVTGQLSNGMLVSNHSYGFIPESIPDEWFGAYTQKSKDVDLIMQNAPYYLMIAAAGNAGNDNTSNGAPLDGFNNYDKLSGKECAKNILVVANAQDANIDSNDELINVFINSSSSQGPTDDYRIKPDITGNGTQVFSTLEDSDSSYDSFDGTSMASPNVTGTLLLLQQYFNELNGNFMKAATLKGLVLHTADDAGANGPDAIFGWGLLNAKKAVEVISSAGEHSVIDEISLASGQSYSTSVSSNGIDRLTASISWTDPAGNVNNNLNDNSPALVNDIDIRITKDGITYYPYKLTSITSSTQGDNIVDPFERIDIENAYGNYSLTISNKGSLLNGTQDVSLIISGLAYSGNCNADDPENTNATLLFGTAHFNWDNVIGATYELRYKLQSDSTWILVSTENESYDVSGLNSGIYNAQVRSICTDEGTYSDWVPFNSPPSFVVKTSSYIFNNSIKIFSDIDKLHINASDNYTIEKVSIYNILGKQLLNNMYETDKITINKDIIGNEKILILKIQLANGIIGYKKILL